MEGSSSNSTSTAATAAAPFVLKTYDMVNDPFTELWIVWGRSNNSFIVMDPLEFSQRILPVYFKHNNFSSFVRQLNTYGFRKVDTDRWEFAHESFLRGQKHLLTNVVRKKTSNNKNSYSTYPCMVQAEEEQEVLLMEVGRLRREQEILNEEVEAIDKRLRTAERRPEQMLAFLSKVVNDPEILTRMVQEKEAKNAIFRERKRRFMLSAASSSSTSTLGDYEHESENYQSIARTELIKAEDEGDHSNYQQDEGIIRSYSTVGHHQLYGFESSQDKYHQQIEPFFYSSDQMEEAASTIPYPFSLLESGF
ncbi:hypothetical protein MKW98_020398 [Papaver atlanticum]|uniref:HSF-type DNA-binding domain-containing protein n=1 Tax=Papaver atlanticum TaxID=357466 RepID=A0AAD4RVQ2_9MAGN|nr:hypothetical protein MKW98_020398 [Papaver atlanticum]